MHLGKKILGLLIIFLGFGGFGLITNMPTNSNVYAQSKNTTPSSMEDNFRDLADVFLKIVYVLLWPLIFLSGLALDNTMVYGEIFHMDTPLRQFWNLCKNFANFGLGFMIIATIAQSVFSKGGGKPMTDTIKKAVIAGIGIQLSRFVVAAIIDISTIATYAVGGMPMSILKTDPQITKNKILQANVDMNLNSKKKTQIKDFMIYWQVPTKEGTTVKISPCATKKSNNEQKYIIGRTYGDERFRNQGKLGAEVDPNINACVYQNEVKFFNEFPDIVNLTGQNYETKRDEIIALGDREGWEACGYVIKLEGKPTSKTCNTSSFITESKDAQEYEWYNYPKGIKIEKNQGYNRFTGSKATSIGEIIDKTKGFVGPLATIYTSLLDFAQLSDTTNTNGSSERKGIGELMIRTVIAAGLILPLLALTIVLLIRIGFLRCVIGASPLIVLIKSFDLGGKLGNLGKQIELKNILSIIFAPVITVFALSICLVFMTTLISTYKPHDDLSIKGFTQAMSSFGITQTKGTEGDKYDTLNIMGFVLRYDKSLNSYAGASGDWFSRMIICFAGIGVMWFVLFAAIKASGLIGESVGKQIQTFGQNTLSTFPILSLPGMNSKVGVGTLFNKTIGDNGDVLGKNITDMRNNSKFINLKEQEQEIGNALDDIKGTNVGKKAIELIKNNSYSAAVEKLTDKEKGKATTDEIVSSIKTYGDVETFIRELEEGRKKEVLIGLGGETLWTNRQNMEEKEEEKAKAKKDFENILGTPKNKTELDTVLAKNEANKLAEKDSEYTIEVTMTEEPKNKYIISVDTTSSPKKLKAEEKGRD